MTITTDIAAPRGANALKVSVEKEAGFASAAIQPPVVKEADLVSTAIQLPPATEAVLVPHAEQLRKQICCQPERTNSSTQSRGKRWSYQPGRTNSNSRSYRMGKDHLNKSSVIHFTYTRRSMTLCVTNPCNQSRLRICYLQKYVTLLTHKR